LKITATKTKVRYYETDQMGFVHHSNYARYFELGRTEWLRNLGINYKEMELNGLVMPVVSLNCNYKKPAYYDDVLTITTSLKKLPTAIIELDYKIENQNKTIICTGTNSACFLNKKTGRPTRCPKQILEKIEL
jgi:conserved hypothetical protein TIGR00051